MAVNEVAEAIGGHDTTPSAVLSELRDVTHTAVQQTPTDMALNSQTDGL